LHASDIYHNILVSKHICDILEAMIRAYVNWETGAGCTKGA
jgi:hypothetical protein